MTRAELISRLAERHPQLIKRDAEVAVAVVLEGIADALIQGHRVEVRGFGSFSLNQRPPRLARNPKTGEPVAVPAKAVPHFKPGKELSLRVNGVALQAAPLKLAA